MNLQLQNWNNFCRYHVGEWRGINTRYSSGEEVIDSWNVVTNLKISQDGSKINHEDYLIYADGKTELKTFGPYIKPITSALFLDNSFCWGSKTLETNSIFIFEIGLRCENRRVLAFIKYGNDGSLEYISISPQLLSTNVSEQSKTSVLTITKENWQGKLKTIEPDLMVLEPVDISWISLKDLNRDNLTLNFQDNISVSCPQNIKKDMEFCIALDWLANSVLLQRGIGYYDVSGFKHFNLQIFTPIY
ncbi:DUF3598 family protein [Mastigocoleus testarum]|uniref:DUF3598 domain-containing protein n=1 Tax=Mastigocoleus testarum BC008 TaxID=371196 RepID=A0A0V7ZWK3_9CYAN|nr:DUF3598 family protein [Mastigocoleus testarum]KST68928.1 hypothetical protein BC008_02305 [Mastigocoleus testarum BC008]KST68997.1 hypothetical protein BC008_02720 [Mastigocoleus testarum BC008]